MSDIVLPLRLDAYRKAAPKENSVKTARGGLISNIEFQGTDGAPVFAMENGQVDVDQWSLDNNALDLVGGDGRIWQYRHIRMISNLGADVKAGQKIGTAVGNLILGVIDKSSDSETIPGGERLDTNSLGVVTRVQLPDEEQLLGRNPLPLLDELDVLPLPQDGGAAAMSTEERHELSESITGKKGLTTAEMAILGGAGVVGLYGLYRLFK